MKMMPNSHVFCTQNPDTYMCSLEFIGILFLVGIVGMMMFGIYYYKMKSK